MKITNELAELLGIMYGDGCLSRSCKQYNIYISGHKFDDFKYHDKIIRRLFFDVFNKSIKISEKKNENTIYIRFRDKKVFNILHSLGVPIGNKYGYLHIPNMIKVDNSLFFSFLRGLIDTDGCIVFSKQHKNKYYYPRIELTSKSEDFLNDLLDILKNNGFYGSVSNKGRGYRLEIPGFKNLERWLKLINFSNIKHIKKIEAHIGPQRPWAELRTY